MLTFSNSNYVQSWEENLTFQTELFGKCLDNINCVEERQFIEMVLTKVKKVFDLIKNNQSTFEKKVSMVNEIATDMEKCKYNYAIPDWYCFQNSVKKYYSTEKTKNSMLYVGNKIDLEKEQKGTLYYGLIIIMERLAKNLYLSSMQ